MPYNDSSRPGTRTSATINPQWIVEDLSTEIKRLDPEQTPFLSILNQVSKGQPPTGHKFLQARYDSFDHWDRAQFISSGADHSETARVARLRLLQISRPNVTSMYYHVQDRFAVPSTGQVLEVIMTSRERYEVGAQGSYISLDAGLTGNTSTATKGFDVIVRNVQPGPIIPFNTTDVIYLGRSIRESQDIDAKSAYRDLWFTYNWVEHKEKVLWMTEDAMKMVQTRGSVTDWAFQEKETLNEFRRDVDYTIMWGQKSFNADVEGEPIRTTEGLIPSIQENIMLYNPYSTTSYEQLVQTFMNRQAFRYNPNGKRKSAVCGRLFMENFAREFKDYRRITNAESKKGDYGFNIQSYQFGDFTLEIAVTDQFRQHSDSAHWLLVFDPAELELRVKKDFDSRFYGERKERKQKLMVEWQGGVSPHRTETHALLRTA